MVESDPPTRDPAITMKSPNRSIGPPMRDRVTTIHKDDHGGSTMTPPGSSPVTVVEDLFLGLAYPLRERGKALTDLI